MPPPDPNPEATLNHVALSLQEQRPVVFTAHAAETFYLRERICTHVITGGAVPINPFMSLGYFLYGQVDPDDVRRANNNLIRRCDELWVYGPPLSDGVEAEITMCRGVVPIRFFTISHHGSRIDEVTEELVRVTRSETA